MRHGCRHFLGISHCNVLMIDLFNISLIKGITFHYVELEAIIAFYLTKAGFLIKVQTLIVYQIAGSPPPTTFWVTV